MRSAIDARHQSPGEGGVKPAGKPGSVQHRKGAGIDNEQNRLPVSEAGTGSRSGAKGGPSDHPQNLVHATEAGQGGGDGGPATQPQNRHAPVEGSRAEEAGESVQYEAQEDRGGSEHGSVDNTVVGPRAVGRPGEAIPHAGRGNDARGVGFKAAPGGPVEHPQNLAAAGADGEGADGKGGAGGGAQRHGGHAQGKVLPAARRSAAKRTPTRASKQAGHFLKALAGN